MNLILTISSAGTTLTPNVSSPVVLQFYGFGGPGVQLVTGNLVTGSVFFPVINQTISTHAVNDSIL